jgi:outer membrane receptor for ferrienterochelin and colicins
MKQPRLIARERLSAGAIGLAMLCGGVPAVAQSVDYEAMEQLFGEPVTTSVTGKPQRATDAPANIEIITQDDIRRSGATTIPDVLRFVTGLDVRDNGIGGADVGIRGYNQPANPYLMVLINGRQIYMVDYGRILWAALPVQLSEIRQIEVIKGPSSALYGFNAVGGVINIITYDPLHDKVNTANLAGGTQSYGAGSVVGTAKIGEAAGLRLSAGGFQSRDFTAEDLRPTDLRTRRPPFSGNFNADGRWQITPWLEAFVEGSYGTMQLSQPSPAGNLFTEQSHQWSARAGVSAETGLGLFSLDAYRNTVDLAGFSFTQVPGLEFREHEEQTVTVAEASDLVKIGANHTFRLALEYRVNSDASALFRGALADNIYAAALMWDWQITPSLTATNAVRVDHASLSYSGTPSPQSGLTPAVFNAVRITEPSLNSGLVWRATEQDTLRLTLARGVQLPTLVAQGIQLNFDTAGPVAVFGKPDLLPAITWNTEVDYDRTLTVIGSVLRTALFAQRTDDVIVNPFGGSLVFTPAGIPVTSAGNDGYSTAAGLELELKGHNQSGWRWNVSYALAATTDHTNLSREPVLISTQLFSRSTPEHVVIAGIGYSRDRWEADLMARWQSSYVDTRATAGIPPLALVVVNNYVLLNARVAYKVTDFLTLALVAQQLNAATLLTTGGVPMERRLIASATARF